MKVFKYVLLGFIMIYVIINLAGCFSFRMGEKERQKYFSNAHPEIRFTYTSGAERKLFYAETNNDSAGFYLLFIHGSPGSGSNFYSYLKDSQLAAQAQIGSVDRPGFGYSDYGKAEPSIDVQARLLEPIFNAHKNQRIILCGHSLGGPVAVKAAMLFPNLVSGVFILAGSVDPALEPKEPWRKPMNHPLLSWMMPKSFKASNREIIPLKPQLESMSNEWSQVKCRVYVLQGGKDILVHPGNADFVASKIPENQRTIIKVAGENHFIPFTNANLLRQHLIHFINQYGEE